MALIVLSDARDDVRAAARWYNRQRRGLGRNFTAAVRAGFTAIERLPQGFGDANPSVPGREVRRFNVNGFPYAIFYEVRGADQVILAVTHSSRQPGGWHSRLPADPA